MRLTECSMYSDISTVSSRFVTEQRLRKGLQALGFADAVGQNINEPIGRFGYKAYPTPVNGAGYRATASLCPITRLCMISL